MEKFKFICYSKCSTCKKAEAFLISQGLEFEKRDIKEDRPQKAELMAWHKKSGYPLKKFFNTHGIEYREGGVKAKLETMSEDEAFDLLASSGMLVKRPIFIGGDFVLLGFNEEQWLEKLA